MRTIVNRDLALIAQFALTLLLTYNAWRNTLCVMIKSFTCKDTQALFEGNSPRRFRAIQGVAERKLTQLDAAATLNFLRAPPGNRLEALKGDRKGQHSIRVNDQWRICFRFKNGDVFDVEIVDYH
jgi:proteic killer suppression protein